MIRRSSAQSTARSEARWATIVLVVVLWAPVTAAYEWHIETVDSTYGVGKHSSLSLDAGDLRQISCGLQCFSMSGCPSSTGLLYAYEDGSGWHIETVDGEHSGNYTSLELDASGHPHVSHGRGAAWGLGWPLDLRYAYRDGSGWHSETVDSTPPGVGGHTSLALAAGGFPHISYHDGTNRNLKYAYKDASGWHIETVDSVGWVGKYTSLRLDGGGWPHISYSQAVAGYALKYAYMDGSGWHIETVDSAGEVGWSTSLALDRGSFPHVSYCSVHLGRSWTPDDLRYAYRDGSGWHVETVDSVGDVGWYSSLTLDGDDRPHISYYDYTNASVKYAYRDASGWHIETVDSVGDAGESTSLALDGMGFPHISYRSNGYLTCAQGLPAHAEEWHTGIPESVRLIRVSPNPARTQATIIYSLGGPAGGGRRASVRIFDPVGRLVATPGNHVSPSGTYSVEWDLQSQSGGPVPPGVYYLRVEADDPGQAVVKRLLVTR